MLNNQDGWLTVRFPDGRVWGNAYDLSLGAKKANPVWQSQLAFLLCNFRLVGYRRDQFYPGSNWITLVSNWRCDMAGLKSDGSLWVSSRTVPYSSWAVPYKWLESNRDISWSAPFLRVGKDTDWNSLSLIELGNSLLLTKTDCTLWWLGPAAKDWGRKKASVWRGFHSFTPAQVGSQSNWAAVFVSDHRPYLRKTDGSVWAFWSDPESQSPVEHPEPGIEIQRQPVQETAGWRSTAHIWSRLDYQVAISTNGAFCISMEETKDKKYHRSLRRVDWQFGRETNWVAVAGLGEHAVTLKNDGTLWVWNFHLENPRPWDLQSNEHEMLGCTPSQLGSHHDWLAITDMTGGIVSLAADGSLWYWPLDADRILGAEAGAAGFWSDDGMPYNPLLELSPKPQLLANILATEH